MYRLILIAAIAAALTGCSKKDKKDDTKSTKNQIKPQPDKKQPDKKQPNKAAVTLHYITTVDGPCAVAVKQNKGAHPHTVFQVAADNKRTQIGCAAAKPDDSEPPPVVWLADKEKDGKIRAVAKLAKSKEKTEPGSGGMVTFIQEWDIYGPADTKPIARVKTEDSRSGRVSLRTVAARYVVAEIGWGVNMSPYNVRIYDTKTKKTFKANDTGGIDVDNHLVSISGMQSGADKREPSKCFDLKAFKTVPMKNCPKSE